MRHLRQDQWSLTFIETYMVLIILTRDARPIIPRRQKRKIRKQNRDMKKRRDALYGARPETRIPHSGAGGEQGKTNTRDAENGPDMVDKYRPARAV